MRSEWMKLKSGSDIRGDAMEHDGVQPVLTGEAAECIECLKRRLKKIDRQIVVDRGDFV